MIAWEMDCSCPVDAEYCLWNLGICRECSLLPVKISGIARECWIMPVKIWELPVSADDAWEIHWVALSMQNIACRNLGLPVSADDCQVKNLGIAREVLNIASQNQGIAREC